MHTHQPTLPGFAPSEATPKTGAADVPVCQVPKGLSKAPDQEKDKLLRSFANGDVCGSCNVAGGCRSSAKGHAAKDKAELQQAPATPITPPRKVDLPVDQKPAGLCEEGPGSPLRSEVNGDVNLPGSVVTPPPPQKPIREIRVIRGQTNSAITRPVTIGMAITQPAVIAERDISYVMDCVREGRFEGKDLKALIVTIRSLPKEPAAIAAGMKKSLPWFSGSTFQRRRGNEFFKAAWFLVFDLDHVPEVEGLKRQALEKLPFLRYAFQSVRDGVKLVAEFTSPITKEDDFRTIWKYLALRIEKSLRFELDSTPDPARACFLSYDPELLVNHHCRPLDPKKTLREAQAMEMLTRALNGTPVSTGRTAGFIRQHPPADQTCPSSEQNRMNPVDRPDKSGVPVDTPIRVIRGQNPDDYEKASKVVQKLAQMVIPYSDWYRIGLALYAGFGEAGRPLWDLFLANPHYRDTQRELDAKWNSFRGVREITLATLFEIGGRHGCQ